MRPYTLEWWLKLRDIALHLSQKAAHYDQVHGVRDRYKDYKKFYQMSVWIKRRIINKYGEKNT